MEFFRGDLYPDGDNEDEGKNPGSDEITMRGGMASCLPEPRHRDRVAARFTQRRCQDLDDPEDQRDLRDFGNELQFCVVGFHRCTSRPSCSRII